MRPLPFLALLTLSSALAGCPDDKKPASTPTPSASASAPAAPSASASASASATPSASAAPSASASAEPAPSASASAPPSATTAAAPADAGVKPCGDKPLPPCPLYAWMKANMSGPMSARDYPALEKALTQTAAFAPPGYGNWASISRDGAKAAKEERLDGVKASCRSCHDQYKTKYKAEMRARKI